MELRTLLRPDGFIGAKAVFDVEGVPTVAFFADGSETPMDDSTLNELRKRIWNQNLVSIIIDVSGDTARAVPTQRHEEVEDLELSAARPSGPFSALDVVSANLSRRLPGWFNSKDRVDSRLLSNLSETIRQLGVHGFAESSEPRRRRLAELLMGQVLFISYLEHREIVGTTYRQRRGVGQLHNLVAHRDRRGVRRLIDSLRMDFNGDFLGGDRHNPWAALDDDGFGLIDSFLSHTEMKTGQGTFWNYDFSFIPVELLSGLYESFLSPAEQAEEGAYYTPRHLATLAIDQAFAYSADPLAETIFDGACGSGILLTTAYRRLIALSEARLARTLTFRERRDLLVEKVFGADTNQMACRVTAFSLYLSLLEGLEPSDIIKARERENTSLPTLDGTNLLHGDHGDFFSEKHGFSGKKFSLLISNPPWGELKGGRATSADAWVAKAAVPFPRRQIAGAYAFRALDFLSSTGRLCLILPIIQFLGPSSAPFVARLLENVIPKRLINFGDLQGLLFPSAEQTCHVFIGQVRRPAATLPFGETFDYCVPKADLSLALGRLTMQSADRHLVQTISVAQDPQILVTLMWGDARDISLWTRLSASGTLGDLVHPGTGGWVARKGVHIQDSSQEAVDVAKTNLGAMPFVPVGALSGGSPTLSPDLLTNWPSDQPRVVGLDDALLTLFHGPRVLYPDGFSRVQQFVRAVYFDGRASFTNSIGVIKGPTDSADLLRFLAAFLRSTLAQYFLMMRSWKMLCDRNALHLKDIKAFPFFPSEAAPDPSTAREALKRVSQILRGISRLPAAQQANAYLDYRVELDECVYSYFALTPDERSLVCETVEVSMPSIRPRSFDSLETPAQSPAQARDLENYARSLKRALTNWRKSTGGDGRFAVAVVANKHVDTGSVGIVRIEFFAANQEPSSAKTERDDEVVRKTLSSLQRSGLAVVPSGDAMQLVPDARLWRGEKLYLVRLLTRRNWTQRQALRDAEQIVREVQSSAATRS